MSILSRATWRVRGCGLPAAGGVVCLAHGAALKREHPKLKFEVLNAVGRRQTCDVCSELYRRTVQTERWDCDAVLYAAGISA